MARKHEIILDLIGGETGGEHPLVALARIAKKSEEQGDNNLAFQCYKELANYVAPKLKSVEHIGDNKDVKPITIIVSDTKQLESEQPTAEKPTAENLPLVEGEPLDADDPINAKFRAINRF